MAAPYWIDFAKPLLLTGKTLDETVVAYLKAYHPNVVAAATVVVDELLQMIEHIPAPPDSALLPDDFPVGLTLVQAILKERLEI